ncbi:LysR family transcriptional regulator [Oceanospirillum sediminis]|uniref:LysR family transcriptional regulator n=1 Tax=Oceanospirillum sediminis TaxID=2760088 RepID=UPI001C71A9F2|nr:LysR family transcriptional regulator [Oceanospirillum sediminis]
MLRNRITDINDYLVFARVAELGSFTRAAAHYELPKSNISRKISRLETDLNVRLLERTTRRLRLTEIGEQVYRHAKRIEEELTSSFDSVASGTHSVQGKLRICTSNTIGIELIAPLLADFNQDYPKANIELQLTNRRVDLIEEDFDLAIRVGHIDDSSLIARQLYQIQLRLFASPCYFETRQIPGHPNELTDHAALLMNAVSNKAVWPLTRIQKDKTTPVESAVSQALFETYTITPKLACDDYMVVREACIRGMGIALLPHYMAEEALQEKKLIPVLPDWQGNILPLYAIYPSRKGVTPKLKAMLGYLISHFSVQV